MDENAVQEYVKRSRSLIEDAPQMDEENTKVKLVQPLIKLLGWDVYSSEVELEYSMQIGRGNTRADYALLVEGTPVVFIEAKGCDTTLIDSDRSQLKSYMRQTGVDWGLLTNGVRFELLKRRQSSTRPDEVSLGAFSIEELAENLNVLNLLSKNLIVSGEADRVAEQMETRRRAVSRLEENKERVAESVTQIVVDEIGNVLTQEIKTESKSFVDRLIGTLSEDVEYSVNDKNGTISQMECDETYLITLYRNGNSMRSLDAEQQSQAMVEVINYLVEEHDLVERIEPLPYVPGRKNAILNTKPEHPTSEEMRGAKKLNDELYLDTNLSRKQKQRYIRELAEMCDLETSFDGAW